MPLAPSRGMGLIRDTISGEGHAEANGENAVFYNVIDSARNVFIVYVGEHY